MSHIFWIYSNVSGQKKRTYIISQKDYVFVESGSRKGKKENLSGGQFYKNLATSTGPEKNRRSPKFQSRMLQYATVRILCNWN